MEVAGAVICFGNFPDYVSFDNCFYNKSPWYWLRRGDGKEDGVMMINSDNADWISKLGNAFTLGNEGKNIPNLVWESLVDKDN